MINLYDSKETNFNNNGIVVLNNCISCSVAEELNGTYELTLEYPLDKQNKWQHLTENSIIKADKQLFRVYHKTKKLSSILVNCRHIFYDTMDNFVEDVNLVDVTGMAAMNYLTTHTQYAIGFTVLCDISESASYTSAPKNVVESIMGTGGIIELFGGELVRDNFSIKLLGARGIDRGVLISYGKNIQGIQEDLDMDGLCTRMYVTGTAVNNSKIILPDYVDSPLINNYPHPKIKAMDFDSTQMPTKDVTTIDVTNARNYYYAAQATNNNSITQGLASTKVISNCSNKNKLTVAEKTQINAEWNKVLAERPLNDSQAIKYFIDITGTYATLDALKVEIPLGNTHIYSVTEDKKWYFWSGWEWKETNTITTQKSGYDTAYDSLNSYISPLLASLSTESIIVTKTFIAKWKAYLDTRKIGRAHV